MKVLEGSYFQKGPPPLIPRNSNPLSEIRELFATWSLSRQIPEFSSEKFSNLKLDSWPDSKQYEWTYEPIHTYGHLKVELVESHHSNYNYLRHCCVDFEQINTCWENATYFLITPIKQALVVHWILYSTQSIAHNLSY